MKDTSRIHRKNKPQTQVPQVNKTSIPGQKAATIGPAGIDIKGKVTYDAVRIGEALDLSENEIRALALVADLDGVKPGDFAKASLFAAIYRPHLNKRKM